MESLGLSHYWWVFLILLAIPPIIRMKFMPGRNKKDEFIYITSLPHHLNTEPKKKVHFIFGIAYAAWIFLMIALMRPFVYDPPIIISQAHRDIMLAVDLSDSMEIQDMYDENKRPISRLAVVKEQLKDFIEARARNEYHDRMGIILFADHAYVLSPLTFDSNLLLDLVDELDLSLAGQLTNMAEAIDLALQRFDESGTNQKILILLSDGKNTTEGTTPIEAAYMARDADMKIYTIGFGGGAIALENKQIENINTSSDLDEETLKQIASITNATYFRARDSKSLHNRYQEISFLEASEQDKQSYQPEVDYYYWPLIISLILSVIAGIAVRRING